MLVGSRARPVLKVDNLTAGSRLFIQCGILIISQPYRPPRLVMRNSFTFFTLSIFKSLKMGSFQDDVDGMKDWQ
jgi:hypothetical protein